MPRIHPPLTIKNLHGERIFIYFENRFASQKVEFLNFYLKQKIAKMTLNGLEITKQYIN